MESAAVAVRKGSRAARGTQRGVRNDRIADAMSIAENEGLLSGGRTVVLRGRMPAALVSRAKRKAGIDSDSKLIEAALAHMATADDYAEWLISQRGSIAAELDLEF